MEIYGNMKRAEFLKEFIEDTENSDYILQGYIHEATGTIEEKIRALVTALMPGEDDEKETTYYFTKLCEDYEQWIDGEEWADRQLDNFWGEMHNYAYFGLMGYVNRNKEFFGLSHPIKHQDWSLACNADDHEGCDRILAVPGNMFECHCPHHTKK